MMLAIRETGKNHLKQLSRSSPISTSREEFVRWGVDERAFDLDHASLRGVAQGRCVHMPPKGGGPRTRGISPYQGDYASTGARHTFLRATPAGRKFMPCYVARNIADDLSGRARKWRPQVATEACPSVDCTRWTLAPLSIACEAWACLS